MQWKDAPEKKSQPTMQRPDPWFGVAMVLIGIVVGFIVRWY